MTLAILTIVGTAIALFGMIFIVTPKPNDNDNKDN